MTTQITKDINIAATALQSGKVVAIPTETVYGLAGIIYNQEAIKDIYRIKKRPLENPLIVHTHSAEIFPEIAVDIPEAAYKLAEAFWPGPLTILLKKNTVIPDNVTSGLDTVAVRVPSHPVTISLLRELKQPVAAPSANPFGRISPTSARHVLDYFDGRISCILDGGACSVGIESTIVGFEDGIPVVYRQGAVTAAQIKDVTGNVTVKTASTNTPKAPGMYPRHYSPRTPLVVTDNIKQALADFQGLNTVVIGYSKLCRDLVAEKKIILPESGNFEEAAAKLYGTLHYADSINTDIIIAERFPDRGLGSAINDRLTRASKK
ncbi:L-threonylcarbamoyladenylate synthase [Flavobacterium sp.]|uniref:L-threonylcarbamoyladenylate synthase n=1 Tax=Flavobacterium sp. TaxID=239 RepID=UPI00261DF03E|nr:L-threonylcarbamoyladenylate synthase [Flavobacterium sp.]